MAAAIRNTDQAARFGGEEFIVLMRDIDAAGLVAQGERIRRVIEAETIVHAGSRINVTISCGAALANDADIAGMIRRADEALYAAKKLGRNRVCADADGGRSAEQAA
jgi:diguanylate cyclase (GGDEF)-like protein